MPRYIRPQLTVFGNVEDLTKSKISTGSDSFLGGQPQPGDFCIAGTCFSSTDSIVTPPPPPSFP